MTIKNIDQSTLRATLTAVFNDVIKNEVTYHVLHGRKHTKPLIAVISPLAQGEIIPHKASMSNFRQKLSLYFDEVKENNLPLRVGSFKKSNPKFMVIRSPSSVKCCG